MIFYNSSSSDVSYDGRALTANTMDVWLDRRHHRRDRPGSLQARSPETFSIALVLHSVLSGCYFTTAAGIFGAFGSMAIGPITGGVIDLTGNAYYHTFTIGCVVALLALGVSLSVYRQFMRLGGPKAYVASE